MRTKIPVLVEALTGRFDEHHAFLSATMLAHIDTLDVTIREVTGQVEAAVAPFQALVDRLDTIPGVNQRAAQAILAEIGPDMSRFPTAGHLASWAGVCPGNNESAGKHYSGRTRKGDTWLRAALGEAAAAGSSTKNSYLHAQYRRATASWSRRSRPRPWRSSARPVAFKRCRMGGGQCGCGICPRPVGR